MPTIEERAKAALVGAICADAAAQTSHWNYDRPVFHQKLQDNDRWDTPEFFVCNSFYKVAIGGQSCYGDQMLVLAEHLAKYGALEPMNKLIANIEHTFGNGSEYGKYPTKKGDIVMPVQGPWRHGSLKGFLRQLTKGHCHWPACGDPDDAQADCFLRIIPVVCAYAGQPELNTRIDEAVRVTQNNNTSVAFAQMAAAILEACILGKCDDSFTSILTKAQKKPRTFSTKLPVGTHEALAIVIKVLELGEHDFEKIVVALAKQPRMSQTLPENPASLIA